MQTNKDLSVYRFETAEDCLDAARILLNGGQYKDAANRSYYCVFHCIRSILALEALDFKKHSAVIAYFRKNYINAGKFESGERLSDIISVLFRLRGKSDYEDFFVISKQEVTEQVENAEYFINETKKYLSAVDL